MTARQRHRLGLEARYMGRPRVCAVKSLHCYGALQADHVIEVRWLTDARNRARIAWLTRPDHRSPLLEVTLDDLIADSRNGEWLCAAHNDDKARGMLRIPAPRLPSAFWEFVDDFGLDSLADRVVSGERPASAFWPGY